MPTLEPSGANQPSVRVRPGPSVLGGAAPSPLSPHTPLLGRSISSQFGSPGSFRAEQEDFVVWELGARHLSAGFAGESRPRCIKTFGPNDGRRMGDYREFDAEAGSKAGRRTPRDKDWGRDWEFYRADLRSLDLGLVEDKLERAVRSIHTDSLMLDQKPRKAVLAVPSLLAAPILEIMLKVLFDHSPPPPSVTLVTTPLLAVVAAGLRNALVVDLGWEETVVTAIGEYREVRQRRSVRAGKMVTHEMGRILEQEADENGSGENGRIDFEFAEDVVQRVAWCRPREAGEEEYNSAVDIPLAHSRTQESLSLAFQHLSDPSESALFSPSATNHCDDHDLPLPYLIYKTLLDLPLDLRALCLSRIVITGGLSDLPGLKHRLLSEIDHLVSTRGWDSVNNYGSATAHRNRVLLERSTNIAPRQRQGEKAPPLSPTKKPLQESTPHADRIHDDVYDPVSMKAEQRAMNGRVEPVRSVVRGVESLGAWAGASLLTSLRVKGVREIDKDDFAKHGLRDGEGFLM